MIVALLLVVIAILLFGGGAVLGVAGMVIGGIATVAVVTYVGVSYEVEHDQAVWGFIGLCVVISAVTGFFAFKENAKKREQRIAHANKWDELRKTFRGSVTSRQYLAKYPEFQVYYDAWLASGRKE